MPTASDDVVIAAAPLLMAALPSVVVPSLNVTDPVADTGTMVAVSVIGTPKSEVALLDVTKVDEVTVAATTVIDTVLVAVL